MGEPGGAAAPLAGPLPSGTRRPASNRIKLNRDLMQRLASALGDQASKRRQQAASDAARPLSLGQPWRARRAKPEGAERRELPNSSNNKSSPTWPPVNQTRQQGQLDVSLLETCFAFPAPAATTGTCRQQKQAERAGVARPPLGLAQCERHEALVCTTAGLSNCSKGKHCCRRPGGARPQRCRAERASSFCYYANDNSAPVRASSSRSSFSGNSAHANYNYSTAPNNAPGKQSDSDANNRSSAPTIARQLAGWRPAAGALFLVAPPAGFGALSLGWRPRSQLNAGRGHHVAGEPAAMGRAAQPEGRRRRQSPLRAQNRRARQRERPQHHHDNKRAAADEHGRPDRFYDHYERRKANRKQTASGGRRRAAQSRRSEIKPTTVIAAKDDEGELEDAARNKTTAEGSIKKTSELSAKPKSSSSTAARAAGPEQEAAKRVSNNKQRAQDSSQRRESSRPPRLQHDSAHPFTQAGPRMAQQFMTCDSSQASTASRANREARWRHAAESSGKLKGVRVRPTKARTSKSLLLWLLLAFFGPLLLLLLRFDAVPMRPLVEPASCLEFASSLAPPTSFENTTGSVQTTRSTSRIDNDEFSRAVMATMSTQSTLASNFTSSEPRLAPSAQALMSQSTGGADFDPSMSGRERSPQEELLAARTPATLNEFESSDDLILADERPLVRGAFADSTSVATDGRASEASSRATTSMEQLHAELQQKLKNGSSASGSASSREPGELEDYLNKFVDFARIFAMVAIMIGDICGNSLVILSVVRHSKLRVTTNWFVVSLACADILVAVFAMTFNASVQITGRWIFPRWMCDFWNSCDVLASTASILHLCCISIDRYYAIMRPLDYPMKITTRRVCYALAVVWISSALLSYIPIFTGIYTTSEFVKWQQENPDQCEFVVNRVYAIVSSSISFWIPCCIMVFTYYKIYQEATRQEKFIYKAQSMMPAPQSNHHRSASNAAPNRSKQHRSKSMAITSLSSSSSTANSNAKGRKANAAQIKQFAAKQQAEAAAALSASESATGTATAGSTTNESAAATEQQPLTGSAVDLNNNNNNSSSSNKDIKDIKDNNGAAGKKQVAIGKGREPIAAEDQDDRDSNSGQSTPTKRSISKMKREHKAAKTLGIIMGVFILCWLPFFSWYTPMHICGHACDGIVPHNVVTLLFWIGYFNSTLNPIIYAYFNHEFRDAFKKTLQWIFCCCRDLKCLRVNRPNDNQHYNCTYRSTQEIGLVTNG